MTSSGFGWHPAEDGRSSYARPVGCAPGRPHAGLAPCCAGRIDFCGFDGAVIKDRGAASLADRHKQWTCLQRVLPVQKKGPRSILGDRLFIEAILFRAKTGLPSLVQVSCAWLWLS